MRIAFFNLRAHGLFEPGDPTGFGGAEVQLYHLSVGLAERGHEVCFVTRGPGPYTVRLVNGVKVHKLAGTEGPFAKCRTVRHAVRVLRGCAAHVYVQRCAGLETAMVAWLAGRQGARFCYMTASTLDCSDQLARRGHPWLYRAYRWGLSRADLVICQDATQQELIETHFGISASVLPSACAPVSEETCLQSRSGGEQVLWVGRCNPYKDPLSFIGLARELPDVPFRMIMPPGDHPGYQHQVENELAGVPNLSVCHGRPFREMEAELRDASVLVNTSDLEGFPNSFLEAMRLGIPILSYRLDPGGVLRREGVGVCVQGDFRRLVDLCRTWHESPQEAERYGRSGREYVQRVHDVRVIVPQFERQLTATVQGA